MFYETFKIAINSLGRNKIRTLLSMLGIIIGVGAVIAVISVASGSQAQVTGSISSMGSNLITINPGISSGNFGKLSSTASDQFTLELGRAIEEFSPDVKRVIPQNQSSGYFMVDDKNYQASLVGTTAEYQEVNNFKPQIGKFFSEYDLNNKTNTIVLGSEIVDELYEDNNPVGDKITYYTNEKHYVFKVIGVMEEKDRGITGNLNDSGYIPITTYLSSIGNSKYINSFMAQAESSEKADNAVKEIEYFLAKYFESEDNFKIFSQDQILSTINEVTGTMTLMISGIAAISLLVGGIGIMNIMLVSVTERTREIGIRKALGAKRYYILIQFLLEATIMSIIGGIIGIIFGSIGSYFISQLGGWPFIVETSSILLAVGFSMSVGIFFGIYPALKASKLDPVDALSYE
ncbi:MAG TPA: ABC transporter permease [Halanaerobiales bacterium]|nr:ABC transporter permease [Halanaerobiales bacterium]